VDAGFGVWIALDADGFAGSLPRAGVGLCALTAHRQAAHVADAAIAFDGLEPLEVHADFAAQISFDDVFAVLNGVNDLRELLFGQIFRPDGRVDVGAGQDFDGVTRADAVNVAQRDIDALIGWDFYTNDACHKMSLIQLFFYSCRQMDDWFVGLLDD
jgi:hypothetical protein